MNRIRIYASLDVPDSRIVRNVQSFVNWVEDNKPLLHSESGFLKHTYDLVSVSNAREYGWLDGVIEYGLLYLPRSLSKV